tara:strand:+ start:51 stop:938 length:888 start_codon:yes stop_codon:yes gene_type:complete
MSEEQTQPLPQDTPSPEAVQEARERQAFETHVHTSGEPIPENFESAGAWFDSLKEAQKQYTRGQQEIAELRKQYAEQGAPEPPPTTEATPEPMRATEDTPELRIDSSKKSESEIVEEIKRLDQETYAMWSAELSSTGTFSEETRRDIKNVTGITDSMLNDYEAGQKARLRESFVKAAGVVGGQKRLDEIIEWASNTLSPDEQKTINLGLSSSSYEVTLRGLNAMYEASVTNQKAQEPAQPQNLAAMSASETGILPYKNKREFSAERNDPRFNMEPKFRQQVEARMSLTDWNHLPQ